MSSAGPETQSQPADLLAAGGGCCEDLTMAGVRRVVPMIFGWEHLALRYSMPLVEELLADELMW